MSKNGCFFTWRLPLVDWWLETTRWKGWRGARQIRQQPPPTWTGSPPHLLVQASGLGTLTTSDLDRCSAWLRKCKTMSKAVGELPPPTNLVFLRWLTSIDNIQQTNILKHNQTWSGLVVSMWPTSVQPQGREYWANRQMSQMWKKIMLLSVFPWCSTGFWWPF